MQHIDNAHKKFLPTDSTALPLWRLITWTQLCASLNHHKVMKSQPRQLVPRKLAANLELSSVVVHIW